MTANEERAVRAASSVDYAWAVTEHLVQGGRIVGGTPRSRATAEWLADQMVHEIGLRANDVHVESFPVVGYDIDEAAADESVGITRLEVERAGLWERVPAAQAMKGAGTGSHGVEAEIVDVGEGSLLEFGRVDVRGRIVLFAATDALFYGAPVQQMAASRGAVGAIVHWPVAPDRALRLHTMTGMLPMVSVRTVDATRIRNRLANGPVVARLVVDNRWDGTPKHAGSNAVGMLTGKDYPDEFVYLCAHLDHWFSGAADNNAGVGSLLAIAKAIVDAGVRPRRTLVFVAFDAEELGGWADSWYDWLVGSYSHAVETLVGPALHPGRIGKIVAMMNMDVVGTRGAPAVIESTPEFTPFLRRVSDDCGLSAAVPTEMRASPTSYDDWPFYQAGASVCQIAWWGPSYDALYHSTADSMETLDPANVRMNIAFNGLGVIRASQADLHPCDFRETYRSMNASVAALREASAGLGLERPLNALDRALRAFVAEIDWMESLPLETVSVVRLNRAMRDGLAALNPKLFVWDFAASLPGWRSVPKFENPTNDLLALDAAIESLRGGNAGDARDALGRVATMQWGRLMDGDGYLRMLAYVNGDEGGHGLWGRGFVPPLTDVHREFVSVSAKLSVPDPRFDEEMKSLDGKRRDLVGRLRPIVADLAAAVSEATGRLARGRTEANNG